VIVDLPLNYGLVVGQDRVIQQTDDARLYVPPAINPVVLALQPSKVNTPGADQIQSAIESTLVTRAPLSTSLDTTVMRLAKGLWELELELSFNADFGSSPATPSQIQMVFNYQTGFIVLSNLFLHAGDATTYSRYRVLISSVGIILLRTPATAAAQNLSARLNVNAIRIL